MQFRLTHNVTKKQYEFTVNDNGDSQLFYHFKIHLNNDALNPSEYMDDGEYSYELFDNNGILAVGLCQVGNYEPNSGTTTSYKPQTKTTYVQYNGK